MNWELEKDFDTEFGKMGIFVQNDDNPEDPRGWDNLGTMYCSHRRYTLGDQQFNDGNEIAEILSGFSLDDPQFENMPDNEVMAKLHKMINENMIYLPLFLYDHSGITMSTGRFSCPWDSGQVGYIAVEIEKVKQEYGWKKMSPKRVKKIEDYLRAEVKTYDDYLTGSVYGYATAYVDENGKMLDDYFDSCWGYYGYNHEESGLMEAAECSIKGEIKRRKELRQSQIRKHIDKLKAYIKNKIPVIYRKPLEYE